MKNISENELVLFKSVADYIKSSLAKVLKKINLLCVKSIKEYDKLKKHFLGGKTYDEVEASSGKFEQAQKKLIEILACQDRISLLQQKNEQRLLLLNEELKKQGIYNTSVDKKAFQNFVDSNLKNINEDSLNINPALNNNSVKKFVDGQVFTFVDGKITFQDEYNQDKIMNLSADEIHNLIFNFPYVVGTIPDEILMMSNIKNNILKEIIMFAAENLNKQSIAETNKKLGSPIERAESISSIAEYSGAVRNYFNVSVKQLLKKNEPKLADEIDDKLHCNEASEFLPSSKRVAVLANGIAGNVPKMENEESEEVRIEQEKESELFEQLDNYLEMLLQEEEKQTEKIEQEQDIKEEIDKNIEIDNKAQEKTESEELDELEEMLQSILKKDDGVN